MRVKACVVFKHLLLMFLQSNKCPFSFIMKLELSILRTEYTAAAWCADAETHPHKTKTLFYNWRKNIMEKNQQVGSGRRKLNSKLDKITLWEKVSIREPGSSNGRWLCSFYGCWDKFLIQAEAVYSELATVSIGFNWNHQTNMGI